MPSAPALLYTVSALVVPSSNAFDEMMLRCSRDGVETTMTCGFLYSCAGYYDYDDTYRPEFPGIDDFAGEVVHPQYRPEDLDYAGKPVVVIGSGATAVTLIPSMTKDSDQSGRAEHVTMLQRSPTWISAVPSRDKKADWLRDHLPADVAHTLIRSKNIAFGTAFYQFCRKRKPRFTCRPQVERKVKQIIYIFLFMHRQHMLNIRHSGLEKIR